MRDLVSWSIVGRDLQVAWALVVAAVCSTAGRAEAPLAQAPAAKPAVQRPASGPARAANRLAKETSPYLLLHAHNPVNWYPWGDEALAKAKAENKLIFLSVGYSSCYWCHVMERESFMDDDVAALLNKHFVCIKVDREERPDIDQIYMTALAVQGRRGGWPLTMLLTPDARPIVGGTYFPPRDKEVDLPPSKNVPAGAKQQVTGLVTFVNLVNDSWQKNPREVADYAGQVAAAVSRSLQKRAAVPTPLPADAAAKTLSAIGDEFDPEYGGFGFSEADARRPKFPEPSNLLFLLDVLGRADNRDARKMLALSLDRMGRGGIRDHLGGGFHRYSTDRYWRIPHFEKMLYDNGQLLSVYARAFKQSGQAEYRHIAEEIVAFVARELTSPEGAFYAALDAETDGEEGQFYVWKREEIEQALTAEEAKLVAQAYGTGGAPNFAGRYALELVRPVEELAAAAGLSAEAFRDRLAPARQKLLGARARRERPLTDTKILTAWNGLMIRGLADAGRLLGNKEYVPSATTSADFVLAKLRTPEGRLRRSYAGGQAHLNAYLDDYAFLVDGLIALHEATSDRRWLTTADELTRIQIEQFWDEDQGGFFFTSDDHEQLLARSKDPVDSALPSGNAVAAANLIYLATALDRLEYLDRAEKTIAAFAAMLTEYPGSMPRMAQALAALGGARKKKSP
ncbi:MAG: thioredoxin domain-containing protein [Planctomycetia bacterium]|nr:thioredoxin domain-containing protein [Planctomycetia bacterium]